MEIKTLLLFGGIATVTFGVLLLSSDHFVKWVSRRLRAGGKVDRVFEGWSGIIVGGFLIALWLLG